MFRDYRFESLNQTIIEIITRIRSYILAHPDILSDKTRWIQGMGWDQTKWEGGEFPTAVSLRSFPATVTFDMSAIVTARPILHCPSLLACSRLAIHRTTSILIPSCAAGPLRSRV